MDTSCSILDHSAVFPLCCPRFSQRIPVSVAPTNTRGPADGSAVRTPAGSAGHAQTQGCSWRRVRPPASDGLLLGAGRRRSPAAPFSRCETGQSTFRASQSTFLFTMCRWSEHLSLTRCRWSEHLSRAARRRVWLRQPTPGSRRAAPPLRRPLEGAPLPGSCSESRSKVVSCSESCCACGSCSESCPDTLRRGLLRGPLDGRAARRAGAARVLGLEGGKQPP